jgi:putative inorganic carbon (HCO3(-)) transporter
MMDWRRPLIGSAVAWPRSTLGWGAVSGLGLACLLALAIALLPLTWVALLVVGSIILVAILLRPQVGVLLLVPAVPFGSLRQVTVGVVNLGVMELLVALVLAAWLMRMAASREFRIGLPPLTLPLLIFLAALSFSLVGAVSLQHSLKEMIKWAEVLILYLFVASEMDVRWRRALVAVMLATGAVVALHGMYQFLFQVGPEGFILAERFMRAYGTFEQPNPYGGYLGLVIPIAAGVVFAGLLRVRGRVEWTWFVFAAACGALMMVALGMSWSRGAWLGFGTAMAAMILAIVVQSGRVAVLVVLFAALFAYVLLAGGLPRVPGAVVQRFSDFLPYLTVVDVRGVEITDANFAVLERMAHWRAAIDMWTDRPWLGIGIGNYEPVYAAYALPLWSLPLGHAHNYYLNIAAETGVFGLAAYLLLWGAALVGAWRATRRTWGWEWGVALGVLGVLVHLTVHNLFDNLYVHGMYLHLAILMGVLGAYAGNRRLA